MLILDGSVLSKFNFASAVCNGGTLRQHLVVVQKKEAKKIDLCCCCWTHQFRPFCWLVFLLLFRACNSAQGRLLFPNQHQQWPIDAISSRGRSRTVLIFLFAYSLSKRCASWRARSAISTPTPPSPEHQTI